MRTLGLVLCLALCVLLVVPVVYAHRSDTTNPQIKQQYMQGLTQQPAAKMMFKGGSPCNCTGKWKTNWGEMTLTQTADNKVTGQYTHDNGKIEGTISGNSFSGRWSESPTYQDPNDGGLVELEFKEDCLSFTGRWKYGTTGDWKENDWSGEKTQGASKLLF
jgi:hypothetical protein